MQIDLNVEKRQLILRPVKQEDFNEIMKLPSRRWLKTARVFVVPLHKQNAIEVSKHLALWGANTRVIEAVKQAASPEKGDHQFPTWYAFKTAPRPKQREGLLKLYRQNAGALYMEMSTGKSKMLVDMATAAFYERRIDYLLLVAPLTVKLSTWMRDYDNEVAKHCPAPYSLHDFSATRKLPDVDGVTLRFVFVNMEALSQGQTGAQLLAAFAGKKFAIGVDEAHHFKNHASIRMKLLMQLGKMAALRWIATGTPMLKNLIDLYAQFEFLDPDIIGVGDYYAFRNRYAIMGGYKNKKVIGYCNTEELLGFISPYVFQCLKSEVADLPPKIYKTVLVPLSEEHMRFYKSVKAGLVGGVSVKNVLEKYLRLQQTIGGYVPDHDNEDKLIEVVPPKQNAKLQALIDIFDEAQGSIVIWARFIPEIKMILEAIAEYDEEAGVSVITGATRKEDRAGVIRDFQSGKNRFFVGTQQAGGVGIELTKASTMVYFSNTFSLGDRAQSEDRAHRVGITHSVTYIDLQADKTIDRILLQSIADKKDLATFLSEKLQALAEAGDVVLSGVLD